MDQNERDDTNEEKTTVDVLLMPNDGTASSWLEKLERVKKVKDLRRARQAARKGKPITLTGRWAGGL